MKLLAVADIHGASNTAKKIAQSVSDENVDIIVLTGDVTNFGDESSFINVLAVFDTLGPPLFYVPGNCDLVMGTRSNAHRWVSIHGIVREHMGFDFLGVGGSNPSPFSTPLELEETEISGILTKAIHARGDERRPLVLVSHPPPWGTNVDKVFRGQHVGSMAVRSFVESQRPKLVLCGHIHEARGMDRIGGTTVVNSGHGRDGYYAVVELDGKLDVNVKFYRFGSEAP